MNEGQNGNGGGAGGGFTGGGGTSGASDGFDALMNGGGGNSAAAGNNTGGVGGNAAGGAVIGSGTIGETVGGAPARQLVVNGVPIHGVVNTPRSNGAMMDMSNGIVGAPGGVVAGGVSTMSATGRSPVGVAGGIVAGGMMSNGVVPGVTSPVGASSGTMSGGVAAGGTTFGGTVSGAVPPVGAAGGVPVGYMGSAGNGVGGGMGYVGPAAPVSSGTGDIALSSGEEKKSKKGWIIGILLVLVLIGIAVAVVMMMPGGPTLIGRDTKKDWEDYYSYLMYGPEGGQGEVTVDTWYSAIIGDVELEETSYEDYRNAYYDSLKEKFSVFYKNNAEKTEEVENYSSLFSAFMDFQTIDQIVQVLEKDYLNGKKQEVQDLIDRYENSNDGDELAEWMLYYIGRYLMTRFAVVKEYDADGCYVNGLLEEDCADGVDLEGMDDLVVQTEWEMNNFYNVFFVDQFYSKTNALNRTMEGL